MAAFTDVDMGNHHGQRRRYILGGELALSDSAIAPGAVVDTQVVYAPAFVHFVGQLTITTPVSTTAEIRIQPVPEDLTLLTDDEFTVATITTGTTGALRYAFYWGEARGLLTGALFASTYCFSAAFRLRIRNTGAAAMSGVSIQKLECIS